MATTRKPKLSNVDMAKKAISDRNSGTKLLRASGYEHYCIAQLTKDCKSVGGFHKEDNFYASKSEITAPKGRVPICKQCLVEYVSNEDGTVDKFRMIKLLPIIDKPYFSEDFEKAEINFASANENINPMDNVYSSVIGEYMRIINTPRKMEFSFSDSDASLYEIEKSVKSELTPYDIIVTNELKAEWGLTLPEDEIKFLQYNYNKYVNYFSVKEEDPVQSALIRDICWQDLKLQRTRLNGGSEKDIIDAKQKLLSTANLTPAQTAKASTGFTIGAFIKHLEEDAPIPEPSEEFKDVDKIESIFMKFFIHILSMMGAGKRGD